MVSVSNVPGQCRQHQKWLNYKSNITADHVLTALKSNLHRAFASLTNANSVSVDSIILEAENVLGLDNIETCPILDTNLRPNEKILQLTGIVESRAVSNPYAKETFLNLLLNASTFTHDIVKGVIVQKFPLVVEIETNVDSEENNQETAHLVSNSSLSEISNVRNTNALSNSGIKNNILSCGFICGVFLAIIMTILLLLLLQTGTLALAFGKLSKYEIPATSENSLPTQLVPVTENIIDIGKETTSLKSIHESVSTTTEPVLTPTTTSEPTKPSLVVHDRSISNGKRKRKHRVTVSSYNEYVLLMSKIPMDREVILSIRLESPLSWPNGHVMLINSLEIHRLSLDGPFSVDILVNILGQTTNIIHLHVKNSGNKLCQRNLGQLNLVKTIKSKFYLPVLRTMVLEEFTACAEVYETLAVHSEELRELKGIAIRNGVLDDSNHYFIQQLLQLSRENLRHLQLSETKIASSVPLFEVASGLRLPKLETIKLDSLSINGTNGMVPIGSSFFQMFPNLRSIVSEHGFLNWRNMSNILVFRNLTKLQIGIDVPESHTSFNVAFIRKAFPVIRSVNINLNFEKCHSEKNQIVGWETVRETLQEISIGSNCKIYANFSMMPWQMRAFREEKYSQSVLNAKYCFTYRLLADRK